MLKINPLICLAMVVLATMMLAACKPALKVQTLDADVDADTCAVMLNAKIVNAAYYDDVNLYFEIKDSEAYDPIAIVADGEISSDPITDLGQNVTYYYRAVVVYRNHRQEKTKKSDWVEFYVPACSATVPEKLQGTWKVTKQCFSYEGDTPRECLYLQYYGYYRECYPDPHYPVIADGASVFSYLQDGAVVHVNQYLVIDERKMMLTSRLRDVTSEFFFNSTGPDPWAYECDVDFYMNDVCDKENYCENDLVWCPDLAMRYVELADDVLYVRTGPGSGNPNVTAGINILSLTDEKMILHLAGTDTAASVPYVELVRASEEEAKCMQTNCIVQGADEIQGPCPEPRECRKKLDGGSDNYCSQLDIVF